MLSRGVLRCVARACTFVWAVARVIVVRYYSLGFVVVVVHDEIFSQVSVELFFCLYIYFDIYYRSNIALHLRKSFFLKFVSGLA